MSYLYVTWNTFERGSFAERLVVAQPDKPTV